MNTDSIFSMILPSFCESSAIFFHSGSAMNAAQLALACSRLAWEMT